MTGLSSTNSGYPLDPIEALEALVAAVDGDTTPQGHWSGSHIGPGAVKNRLIAVIDTLKRTHMPPELIEKWLESPKEVGPQPAPPEFVITVTAAGGYTLRCPHCLVHDQIVEADRAERWNTLNISGNGTNYDVIASCGDSEYEFDHWVCAACAHEVSAPAGFQILEWV